MASVSKPQPGLVIRYAYLWRHEAEAGREEGKDRPCAVVLAAEREGGNTRVYVAPITHTLPEVPSAAIELAAQTKARLGLDGERSWVITNQVNSFTWPGPDIRPANAKHPEQGIAYGYLPYKTTRAIAGAVRAQMLAGKGKSIDRDELPPTD